MQAPFLLRVRLVGRLYLHPGVILKVGKLLPEVQMKNISVVVAGSGQIRDIQVQPGTTAGEVLDHLSLKGYLLSKGPNDPFFAAAETIYDKVNDGEKLFASTKAEVGLAA